MTWPFTETEFGKSGPELPKKRKSSEVNYGGDEEKKTLSSGSEDRSHWAEEAVVKLLRLPLPGFPGMLTPGVRASGLQAIGDRAKR